MEKKMNLEQQLRFAFDAGIKCNQEHPDDDSYDKVHFKRVTDALFFSEPSMETITPPTHQGEKDLSFMENRVKEFRLHGGAASYEDKGRTVQDHVNETFEGLNDLIKDTEVVWWYKELITQTVHHYVLQEQSNVFQALNDGFVAGRSNQSFEDFKNEWLKLKG